MLAAGCMYGSPQSCGPSAPALRIIVKFVNTSRSPPEDIELRTPDNAMAALRLERAMSGKAHLYTACGAERRLASIIQALNQRPDVQYAEADRKLSY